MLEQGLQNAVMDIESILEGLSGHSPRYANGPHNCMVSEFIKFDTISKGLKIGFKKYTIKLLIILKKEVYFLIPA